MTAVRRSVSDDDLCATCCHRADAATDSSFCALHWPGRYDADGYLVECTSFEELQQHTPSFEQDGGIERVRQESGQPERIQSVMIQDIVGEYDEPSEIPELSWIEQNASFKHVYNGVTPGVWDFILNLSRDFAEIPDQLAPTIELARANGVGYILFHQGG